MDGWKTIFSFYGFGLFSGAFPVSLRDSKALFFFVDDIVLRTLNVWSVWYIYLCIYLQGEAPSS